MTCAVLRMPCTLMENHRCGGGYKSLKSGLFRALSGTATTRAPVVPRLLSRVASSLQPPTVDISQWHFEAAELTLLRNLRI